MAYRVFTREDKSVENIHLKLHLKNLEQKVGNLPWLATTNKHKFKLKY